MSADFTFSLDMRVLLAKLDAFKVYTDKTLEELIDQQARLLISDRRTGLLSMTPPSSSEARGAAAKRRGERRVAMDILKVYQSASGIYKVLQALDKNLADAFYKAVKKGDHATAMKIFKSKISSLGSTSIGAFDPSLHKRWRRNGVVIARYPQQIVTDSKTLDRYIKSRQKNVGILASGLKKSASELGVKLPAWVDRHPDSRSHFRTVQPKGSGKYTVEIGSSVGFQKARQRYRFDYAVKYRKSAMARALPHIKKRIAKQAKLTAVI